MIYAPLKALSVATLAPRALRNFSLAVHSVQKCCPRARLDHSQTTYSLHQASPSRGRTCFPPNLTTDQALSRSSSPAHHHHHHRQQQLSHPSARASPSDTRPSPSTTTTSTGTPVPPSRRRPVSDTPLLRRRPRAFFRLSAAPTAIEVAHSRRVCRRCEEPGRLSGLPPELLHHCQRLRRGMDMAQEPFDPRSSGSRSS